MTGLMPAGSNVDEEENINTLVGADIVESNFVAVVGSDVVVVVVVKHVMALAGAFLANDSFDEHWVDACGWCSSR